MDADASLRLPDPPLGDGEIVLRAWTLSDVPALTAGCQDPDIPRWTVVPSLYWIARDERRRRGRREDLVMFSLLAEDLS